MLTHWADEVRTPLQHPSCPPHRPTHLADADEVRQHGLGRHGALVCRDAQADVARERRQELRLLVRCKRVEVQDLQRGGERQRIIASSAGRPGRRREGERGWLRTNDCSDTGMAWTTKSVVSAAERAMPVKSTIWCAEGAAAAADAPPAAASEEPCAMCSVTVAGLIAPDLRRRRMGGEDEAGGMCRLDVHSSHVPSHSPSSPEDVRREQAALVRAVDEALLDGREDGRRRSVELVDERDNLRRRGKAVPPRTPGSADALARTCGGVLLRSVVALMRSAARTTW